MNPKEQSTPEEKLLNLIRRPDKKSSKQKPPPTTNALPEDKASKSEPKLKPSLEIPVLKNIKFTLIGIKSLNFALINRLILILITVVFLIMFAELFLQSTIFTKWQSSKEAPEIVTLDEKEIKPYSYYEQEIAKRQLFSSSLVESETKKAMPAGATFKELIKGLKLIGVVSTGNPKVIVEDTKLNKTYFLHMGDYLGEIRIEEISSDSVTLEFNGERISLFL